MNRILIKRNELTDNDTVILSDYRAEHIITVLKPQIGDKLRIGVLNGSPGTGIVSHIQSTAKSSVTLKCTLNEAPLPVSKISLMLALPRPKILKRLIPQIIALGIDELLLTNAAKVEKNYFATHWLKTQNLEKLIINGLEQSGDTRIPNISIIKKLKPFIEDELSNRFRKHNRLIAHPYPVKPDTGNSASDIPDSTKQTLIAIGPEGGWDNYELKLFQNAGFTPFSMGSRILRSDTATIATLAILNSPNG